MNKSQQFSYVTFGPFDAPVVVFYGPNEAGKSTILNFVRTILFGFPTQRRKEHYPPNAGGKHGGRIVLTGGDGIDYVVQLAATSAFYSPDQGDDRFEIGSEAGKVTDVSYGLSQAYPWDNAAWAPANVAQYAARPSGSFADSLQHA